MDDAELWDRLLKGEVAYSSEEPMVLIHELYNPAGRLPDVWPTLYDENQCLPTRLRWHFVDDANGNLNRTGRSE